MRVGDGAGVGVEGRVGADGDECDAKLHLLLGGAEEGPALRPPQVTRAARSSLQPRVQPTPRAGLCTRRDSRSAASSLGDQCGGQGAADYAGHGLLAVPATCVPLQARVDIKPYSLSLYLSTR